MKQQIIDLNQLLKKYKLEIEGLEKQIKEKKEKEFHKKYQGKYL